MDALTIIELYMMTAYFALAVGSVGIVLGLRELVGEGK
jgi:hypothetical protein